MAAGRRGGGVEEPLDGGGWSWVIVGSCFMVTVCTRAVTRCVSIFFVEFQSHFGADTAATSWIHSLVDCTTMLCAPIGSLVGSRWSCRVSVVLGGLLSSGGLLLSSLSSSLEQLYLTMGVLTGLGFALCYTPAISTVGVYFRRRRALAFGVAMSGGGVGTLVLAPALQLLIERYSWRGALLVLAALVANLCVCGALLRPIGRRRGEGEESAGEEAERQKRGPVSSRDPELAPPAPRRRGLGGVPGFLLLPDFLALAASFLLLALGCSPPAVFLVPMAMSRGVTPAGAAGLLGLLGVLGVLGNLTFGWLTDRRCLKPHLLTSYLLAVAMEGLCCLLAPLLTSFSLLAPFAVVYGYFDGAYVALIPVVTADVVGARSLPSALGVVYFLHAIPYLVSPPIGGWLVDVTGSYTATFFFSGVSLLSSAAVMAAIVWMRRRRPAPEAPPPRPSDQSEAGCRSAASSRPIGSTDGGDEACDWPAEKR